MVDCTAVLTGKLGPKEEVRQFAQRELVDRAITLLNDEVLPSFLPLFDDEPIPTNQRNLTDVRTRMGVLLEYELCKAIRRVLPTEPENGFALAYVISNKYPDLAFRGPKGEIGLRFEVKAIQTIAEEKSANFDTLIKDIRRGSDFVVVLVWEWQHHQTLPLRYPRIDAGFVFDAYDLALMRDCYWLNTPPTDVGDGRQGYDLCFGVNCNRGNYNQEEGNYGKLLRVFDADYEKWLPTGTRASGTLSAYYDFVRLTCRLGLERVIADVGARLAGTGGHAAWAKGDGLEVVMVVEHPRQRALIVGGRGKPTKAEVLLAMRRLEAVKAMSFNEKFRWDVRDKSWRLLGTGTKPGEAMKWAEDENSRLACIFHEWYATARRRQE